MAGSGNFSAPLAGRNSNRRGQTAARSKSGAVVLKVADVIRERSMERMASGFVSRIQSGDYGKAAEYIAVDPNDPSKGYKLKEGTGNLAPPLVTRLTLSYQAQAFRKRLVTQNGFLLTDQTDANQAGSILLSMSKI